MQIAIFGLTITSRWANSHAAQWRGLCRALAARGHCITFFERNLPHFAMQREEWTADNVAIDLYSNWASVRERAARAVAAADVTIVASYCPDALEAEQLAVDNARLAVFYDLDAPATLHRLRKSEPIPYIGSRGLLDYDLVLSSAGGPALDDIAHMLGARRVAPLYRATDPEIHRPVAPEPHYAADLSYAGSYTTGRLDALDRLFIESARRAPEHHFVLGGTRYPEGLLLPANVATVDELPPGEQPAFFSSSPLTLHVAHSASAPAHHSPTSQLFEAAACGTAVLCDVWDGMSDFFAVDTEILCARDTADVLAALRMPASELREIGAAARERVLRQHTAAHRAAELEDVLARALRPRRASVTVSVSARAQSPRARAQTEQPPVA